MNIAWNATSLDAKHINEVHVNFSVEPPKSLILQIDVLPGGTTADYVGHISQSLKDVTDIYADYNKMDSPTSPQHR